MIGRIQGLLLVAASLGLAAGCGAGVAGVIAGTSDSGGSSNAPPGSAASRS